MKYNCHFTWKIHASKRWTTSTMTTSTTTTTVVVVRSCWYCEWRMANSWREWVAVRLMAWWGGKVFGREAFYWLNRRIGGGDEIGVLLKENIVTNRLTCDDGGEGRWAVELVREVGTVHNVGNVRFSKRGKCWLRQPKFNHFHNKRVIFFSGALRYSLRIV